MSGVVANDIFSVGSSARREKKAPIWQISGQIIDVCESLGST